MNALDKLDSSHRETPVILEQRAQIKAIDFKCAKILAELDQLKAERRTIATELMRQELATVINVPNAITIARAMPDGTVRSITGTYRSLTTRGPEVETIEYGREVVEAYTVTIQGD